MNKKNKGIHLSYIKHSSHELPLNDECWIYIQFSIKRWEKQNTFISKNWIGLHSALRGKNKHQPSFNSKKPIVWNT